MKRHWLRYALLSVVILLVGIQLVPVDRSNPPSQGVVPAPAPALAVLRRACYDCHSNETRWPWYAYVAPVSWVVADDVHAGRKEMNFTEWNHASVRRRARVAEKVWEEVSEGNMPLPRYLRAHPEARLSKVDLATLREWTETAKASAQE